jgi:hypothetical protein
VRENKTLRELFSFPGFYAKQQLQGVFGDPKARIVELKRQKKGWSVQVAVKVIVAATIQRSAKYETLMRRGVEFISALSNGE